VSDLDLGKVMLGWLFKINIRKVVMVFKVLLANKGKIHMYTQSNFKVELSNMIVPKPSNCHFDQRNTNN